MSSLRFNCQNGHNFFLSIDQVTETYEILTNSNAHPFTSEVLNKINWCSKCCNYFDQVKQACLSRNFDVLGGLHEPMIRLQCQKSHHQFKISYTKKLQNLSCLGCNLAEKEDLKQRLRREEELRNEHNRLHQEKLFAQAQEHMARE